MPPHPSSPAFPSSASNDRGLRIWQAGDQPNRQFHHAPCRQTVAPKEVDKTTRQSSARRLETRRQGYRLHRELLALGIANYAVRPRDWDEYGKKVKTDNGDGRQLVLNLDRPAFSTASFGSGKDSVYRPRERRSFRPSIPLDAPATAPFRAGTGRPCSEAATGWQQPWSISRMIVSSAKTSVRRFRRTPVGGGSRGENLVRSGLRRTHGHGAFGACAV